MIQVDNLMIQKYHISLLQMMENAAYNLARFCQIIYPNRNGGGGLGAARRLHNWGYKVSVLLAEKTQMLKPIPKIQYDIISNLKIDIYSEIAEQQSFLETLSEKSLIIDALLGYSLKGNPKNNYAKLIQQTNEIELPVVSLDIPSGIEGTIGTIYEPTIVAEKTLTLALPKTAFRVNKIKKFIGELFAADISVPMELYEEMGLTVNNELFNDSPILEILDY
ncbi:MAG: NAD(P)H-hydrate epimerase [Candidatus Heimdallarchaeota archaeon]